MKSRIVFLSLFLAVATAVGATGSSNVKKEFVAKDTSWKSLSLREKIGQTMIVVSKYYHQSKMYDGGLKAFFEKYPVGGLFIADWYFGYWDPKDSSKLYYTKKAMNEYNHASKFPLIVMEDFERGMGDKYEQYPIMPVEMCLGAANSPQLAYDYEKSIALDAKTLGINWLLHPVCDLNMNPLHSLLNERTISDNADLAIPLLQRQVDGLTEQGIIATIKHFPGDGTTMRDQHLMTATNNLSLDEWKKTYGKLFQSLIDNGAPSVMVGHITFPAYQKEKFNGEILPASLSKELMQGLLKKEMNFKGVVISDALNMGGASGYYPNELETSIASFAAGVDLMLWPNLTFMDSVEARIKRKEIPMQRLDDAVARIWALKERYGLLKKKEQILVNLAGEDKAFVDETGKKIAEAAVTAVRVAPGSLPLDPKKDKKILLVNVSHTDKAAMFEPTKKLLEARGFTVYLRHDLSYFDWNWRTDSLKYFDRIIACFENKYFDPVGISFFKGDEASSVWTLNTQPKDQIIAISYSNPYYVKYYFQHAPVLINAYSSDAFVQGAVVKALLGEIPMKGVSPVNLDNPILK